MIRLALSELRDGWRSWVGMFFMIIVASTIMGACATLGSTWLARQTGNAISTGVDDVLAQLTTMVSGFSGVTAIIVLSSVAAIAVQGDRRRYARWQLIGITPAEVSGVVVLQLVILAFLGALIGLLVAAAAAQPTIDLVVNAVEAATGDAISIHATVSAGVFGAVGILIVVVVLLSGIAPARRAARIPPMEVLRADETPRQGMSILRWVLTGLCAAAVVGLLISTIGNSVDIITLNTIFACILLAATVAAAAPVILPPIIRSWPRMLPTRASTTWFLARTSAAHRLQYSASSVTPLMVGIALIGSIYSAAYTQRNAMLANGIPIGRMELANDQVVIMLGGPLILAAFGAATAVFQGSHQRLRNASVLSRIGIRSRAILYSAFLEAIIYVVTAFLVAFLVIVLVVSVESAALIQAVGPSLPTITFGPILIVAAIGLLLDSAGALLPLAQRRK